jgi:hypothetical protein
MIFLAPIQGGRMTALVELGTAGWLKPGRYRWLRALVFMIALAVLCVLAFNVAADTTLQFAAFVAGQPFTTRAAAPTGARLAAVLVGSLAMLGAYVLMVRWGERRAAREIDPRHALRELSAGSSLPQHRSQGSPKR